MGKIIAVTNQKGGVGKTTTSVNLAASLCATKRRVLLVDLDPQGNATMGCGVNKYDIEQSAYELLIEDYPIDKVIIEKAVGNFDLIPSNIDLTAAEVELVSLSCKEQRLRFQLAKVKSNYDYIIIDCPPSLSMLTLNALVAADSVIIPMQCEYYSLEGLSALIDTIKKLTGIINPDLKIEGLLRTMYDPRNSLTNDVSGQLLAHFGDQVFRTTIPRNVRLAEAPSYGIPVLEYDSKSRGAIAYLALAGEMIRKDEQKQKLVSSSKPTHSSGSLKPELSTS